MKQYGFGVDIGGTTCKIGLFDMNGTILEKWEIKTNTENHGAAILDDVAAAVLGKLDEKNISKEEVQGIGLGVPGPVGPDGTVFKCVNLGWDVLNVEKELSEKTGIFVKVGNDANVAALGEMWQFHQIRYTLLHPPSGWQIISGFVLLFTSFTRTRFTG